MQFAVFFPGLLERQGVESASSASSTRYNARLAIYETYRFKLHGKYQVSGRRDTVEVYLPTVDIRVVDLVTKKTLVTDKISLKADQTYRVPANIQQGKPIFLSFLLTNKGI